MISILLISQNVQAESLVESLVESLNRESETSFRLRAVASVENGREWLQMQEFDVVLLDNSVSDEVCKDLFGLACDKNSLTIPAIFDFENPISDKWNSVLQGAQVYSGSSAMDELRTTLEKLPERTSVIKEQCSKVLLVEDLDSPRDIIVAYIQSLGYPNVFGAASANEGLEILRKDPGGFFCIITDINMPEVNGIELIKMVRADEQLDHIPITVLTSAPTAENLIECIRAGTTGFLVKPPQKKLLQKELDKSKRILRAYRSARLCSPEEAVLLEDALVRMGVS